MNKINLSMAMLLASSLLVACGSKSNGGSGGSGGSAAGSTGTGGSTGGTTGTGGSAGGTTGTGGATGPAPDMGAAALKSGGSCTSSTACDCKDNAFPHSINGTEMCVCQSGTPKACDTACVDPTTDVANCGACNMKCAAHATCVSSKCGVEPTVFATAPAGEACTGKGMKITSSGGSIYWTDPISKKVMSQATTATTATAVSSTETTAPTLIAVNGTTVYWVDAGKTIRKSAGGTISMVYMSPAAGADAGANDGTINGLVADATNVYFSTGNTVMKVAGTGGAATVVATENNGKPQPQGLPQALALQGTLIAYPTAVNNDVDIVTLGGTAAQCVASPDDLMPGQMNVACDRVARSQGEENFDVILPNGTSIIWANGANLETNDFGPTAAQNNLNLGSVSEVETDGGVIRGMALANGVVYLTSYDDQSTTSGYVFKVNLTGTPTMLPLARGLDAPTSMTVDGGKLYFADGNCSIETLAAN